MLEASNPDLLLKLTVSIANEEISFLLKAQSILFFSESSNMRNIKLNMQKTCFEDLFFRVDEHYTNLTTYCEAIKLMLIYPYFRLIRERM